MATRHAKSPCCQGSIQRYGNRRRRCSRCGRTWRVRQHTRGRRRRRINRGLLGRVLIDHWSLRSFERWYPRLTRGGLGRRFRSALTAVTARPRRIPPLPGNLILLGDGLWFKFKGLDWTLYLMLLRPVRRQEALRLDPILIPGKESARHWREALASIPERPRKRIIGFVTDDFSGAKRIAQEYGWIHQLCHFHLLAQLQIRRGRRKRAIPSVPLREEIYQCIREALLTTSERRLTSRIRRLETLARALECPRKLRLIVNEFIREVNTYRAYLRYPTLNLPTTTNAVESTGRFVRKTCGTLNNPRALEHWATALIRFRPYVKCNGKNQPN